MFNPVKKHVDRYLAGNPLPGVRSDRFVSFDVTNRRIDGTCFLFFGDDEQSPAMVAKAARTEAGKAVFRIEYDNLLKLDAIGMNAERPTTPAPLGRWQDGDTLITLQSALPGVLMKNVPGDSLFSPDTATASIAGVLDWWSTFQERFGVERVELGGDAYGREVLAPVDLFRRRYLLDDDEEEFLRTRFRAERRLEGADLPFMARHGDFCAANLVMKDERIGVFDWEFPLEHCLPLLDLFFFASVRFPYSGRRGESTHFDSFREVYWGDSYFSRIVRETLGEVCRDHRIAETAVADLFVLAVIQVANMKYDGLIDSHGMEDAARSGVDRSDAEKTETWGSFHGPDKDAPFACIRHGVFENLRCIVRRGLPRLGTAD